MGQSFSYDGMRLPLEIRPYPRGEVDMIDVGTLENATHLKAITTKSRVLWKSYNEDIGLLENALENAEDKDKRAALLAARYLLEMVYAEPKAFSYDEWNAEQGEYVIDETKPSVTYIVVVLRPLIDSMGPMICRRLVDQPESINFINKVCANDKCKKPFYHATWTRCRKCHQEDDSEEDADIRVVCSIRRYVDDRALDEDRAAAQKVKGAEQDQGVINNQGVDSSSGP